MLWLAVDIPAMSGIVPGGPNPVGPQILGWACQVCDLHWLQNHVAVRIQHGGDGSYAYLILVLINCIAMTVIYVIS